MGKFRKIKGGGIRELINRKKRVYLRYFFLILSQCFMQ